MGAHSILIVTGGRDFNQPNLVNKFMDDARAALPSDLLVAHGHCPSGADSLAEAWALLNDLPIRHFDADWDKHGAAAGPIRNSEMIAWGAAQHDAGARVLVLAFPGGRGTADCLRKATKAGLQRWEISITRNEVVHRGKAATRAKVAQ